MLLPQPPKQHTTRFNKPQPTRLPEMLRVLFSHLIFLGPNSRLVLLGPHYPSRTLLSVVLGRGFTAADHQLFLTPTAGFGLLTPISCSQYVLFAKATVFRDERKT